MQNDIRKLIQLTEAKEETLVADPLPYGSGDLAPVLSNVTSSSFLLKLIPLPLVIYPNDNFKKEMLRMAMTIQGSGWVYLAKNGTIKTTPNQSYKTDILLPIDMWEHSFMDYIPAKDAKKKYIENMMKIVNWDVVNGRVLILIAGPFAKLAAYAAIAYGAWTIWKKEK